MTKKAFSIYDCLVFGVKSTLNNFRLFFLSTLVFIVSTVLFSIIVAKLIIKTASPELFKQTAWLQESSLQKTLFFFSNINMPVFIVSLFLIIAFIIVIISGYIKMGIDIYEKGESKVSRIFSQFYLIPKIMVSTFLVSIITLLGLILFIIPGFIVFLRLRYVLYFIVDKNCAIVEGLKKSYNATRGFTWNLFGLHLIVIVLSKMVSVFALPIFIMTEVAAYKKLSE